MKHSRDIYRQIAALTAGQCRLDEPLSRHTSFRIGGPADLLVIPGGEGDLQRLLQSIGRHRLPCLVIGNGTNLLVRDKGVRGVVIKMTRGFRGLFLKNTGLTVQAGLSLSALVEYATDNQLSGLEWAVGIPGSLGGALVMNAGAYGGQMADVVKTVWGLLPTGDKVTIRTKDIHFSYRHAEYPGGLVITGCRMEMQPGDAVKMRTAVRDWMMKRKQNQPLSLASAGCIFKNPPNDSARRLIGVAGLRGARSGGAQVSVKHANFIVNQGGATADDVLRLIELVRTGTLKQLGIELVPEVRVVGQP